MTQKLFVIAAGGTGGHLFPAQALAQGLLARGHRVALITDPRFAAYTKGFEGVEIHTLPTRKMSGGIKAKLLAAFGIIRSILFARKRLKQLRPQAVIGFGGYPSFPTMQAAIWLKLPTLIHEQNQLMGRANRLLARGVRIIAGSFPGTLGIAPASIKKLVLTGNPVRPAIAALHGKGYQCPQENEPWNLLIFGGSQGAKIFSDVVPAALEKLPEALRNKLRIVQQARAEEQEKTIERYTALGIPAVVKPFFDDMPEQIAQAHLVICRSGASTLAELTVAGRPAIYAPYPHAADDHQRYNAEYAVMHGAGWLMPDAELTPDSLAAKLEILLSKPQLLEDAAAAASRIAIPDAAGRLTDLVFYL